MNSRHLTCIVVGLVLFATGCSDDPTHPGNNVQNPRDPEAVPSFVSEFEVDVTSMTVDSKGQLLFSDPSGNRILKYSPDGELTSEWPPLSSNGSELSPFYIEHANDKLCIISGIPTPSRIVVYDSQQSFNNEWLEQHANSGDWGAPLDQIGVDASGYTYVLRYGEGYVVKYKPDGTFEREWLTHGTNPTVESHPSGIAVGPNEIVYISDTLHNRILMFSAVGELIDEIGERGDGDAQFHWPTGLAIDSDDILYVVDTVNRRIQKLTLNGEYLAEFRTGDRFSPAPRLVTVHGGNVHVMRDGGVVKHYRY